jgi:pimeloyl-ACP methyl ester carboxylesterase
MNVNIERIFAKIDHPIFIIWGKENPLVSSSLLERFIEINPSIESMIFEHTKMMPHEEQSTEFHDVCHWFFE